MDANSEMGRLDGRVALITGATRGIGEGLARRLGQLGARVLVNSRKQDAVDKVVASLRDEGIQTEGFVANVGKMAEARGLIDAIGGRLDILVNNAAANPYYGPIVGADEGVFDKIMDVNVKAPFELCKRAHPALKASRGVVLNISSIGGLRPEQGLGIYSVSKAALVSLTRVLAREWGRDGIRVNVVCPGLIRTDFSAAMWREEATLQRFEDEVPLGRIGEVEDVVGLCSLLVSDQARYCTGGVYLADGGYLS